MSTPNTICPAGHPQTGDNIYLYRGGRRGCRLCRNEAQRQRRSLITGRDVPPPPTPGMCRKGLHPLTEGNLYTPPSARRRCLACHNVALRASNARLAERRRAARPEITGDDVITLPEATE